MGEPESRVVGEPESRVVGSADLAGNGKPFPLSLAESAHNVHLPCGQAVMRVPYTARSSHPRKCSDSEHFMLLLW